MSETKAIALIQLTLFLTIIALQCVVAYYAWDKYHYLIILIFILRFIKNGIHAISKRINNETFN